MAFAGFSEEAFQFFGGLRKNNTREWFQPRKDVFDVKVRAVMEELVGLVNNELGKFAPAHIAEPKKAVYRIYRDTRFSNDKTPYKTHIAANFPRIGMEKHAAAGFYCSVSDQQINIGGGVYMPDKDGLLAIREYIAESTGRFRKIVTGKKVVSAMGPLQGEALRRVPKGFDTEHEAAEFLRMKQWMFFKALDGADWMKSPGLAKEVAGRFKLVAPLVEFLNEPLVKAAKKLSAAEMLF